MYVRDLSVRDFRNHERADLRLEPGVTVLEGPVGAGKTNLLEALYFACVGRSFRTANDRELIRFDAAATRVVAGLDDDGIDHRLEVALERAGTKVLKADGARLDRPAELDVRPLVCVFAPDRLELVKGAAGLRRAHLDEVVAALWPARRDTRRSYTRALAQRNGLLGRIRAGRADAASLGGWTRELARHGMQLMRDRAEVVDLLSPRFAALGGELGLPSPPALAYKPRSKGDSADALAEELYAALQTDLERGFTTHGPHRDDLVLELDGRALRRFGSQGQQRLALLALLLAERDMLAAARSATPVLLLDDVLSELDDARRDSLLEMLERDGQALLTTADPSAVAGRPSFARIRVGAPGSMTLAA